MNAKKQDQSRFSQTDRDDLFIPTLNAASCWSAAWAWFSWTSLLLNTFQSSFLSQKNMYVATVPGLQLGSSGLENTWQAWFCKSDANHFVLILQWNGVGIELPLNQSLDGFALRHHRQQGHLGIWVHYFIWVLYWFVCVCRPENTLQWNAMHWWCQSNLVGHCVTLWRWAEWKW